MFRRHKYELLQFEQYRDVSFGYPGERRTQLLICCEVCDKLKVKSIPGWWTRADLEGGRT